MAAKNTKWRLFSGFSGNFEFLPSYHTNLNAIESEMAA
jgi:hypothetical protein